MIDQQEPAMPTKAGGALAERLASKPALQIALILLTASLLALPCLLWGIPAGDDATIHVTYQHHFSKQLWEGDLYPRWLAMENKGTGSPIFLVQYPLPYFVTALLRPVTSFPPDSAREARELGVFCFIALACAGIAAWCWFKTFTAPLAATFASVLYLLQPYFSTVLYRRAAIGELCALIWLPLLLSGLEKARTRPTGYLRYSVCLALLLASNPLICMISGTLILAYAVVCASQAAKRWVYLAKVAAASLLGLALAAVYLAPAAAYRHLFRVDAMSYYRSNFELGRSFLYLDTGAVRETAEWVGVLATLALSFCAARTVAAYRQHRPAAMAAALVILPGLSTMLPGLPQQLIARSGLQVTSFLHDGSFINITLLVSFSTILLGLMAFCRSPKASDPRQGTMMTLACLSFLMMLPVSAPLWQAVSGLSIVQFAFRFGSVMTVTTAAVVAGYLQSRLAEHTAAIRLTNLCVFGIGAGALVAVIVTTSALLSARQPEVIRHSPPDMDIMYRAYLPQHRVDAFAKMLGTSPRWGSAFLMPGDDTFSSRLIAGEGEVAVLRESPRLLRVSSECLGSGRLRIRQLYFPGWKKVGGDGTEQQCLISPEGLIEVPLAAGKERFDIVFEVGAAERWGLRVTAAAAALAAAVFAVLRRRYGQNSL